MNLPLEKNMCNDITIEMNDGFKLNAKHFKSEQCDKLIIIASAMAVPSRKYEKFAKHCAENGLSAVVFDFRGVESNSKNMKDASIEQWVDDIASLVDYFDDQYETVNYLGHSIGAQIFGLIPNYNKIAKTIFVCASTGTWWKSKPLALFLQAAFVMNVYIPLSNKLFGYTNTKLIKMGVNMPKTASSQWAKWCRSPNYIESCRDDFSNYSHDKIAKNILNITVTDDTIATPKTNAELKAIYGNVNFDNQVIKAEKPIGHQGLFHSNNMQHWGIAINWIKS